jgi:pre-mRNA-splicing factor 38A
MSHSADAKLALNDSRGYTGVLIHNDNPLKILSKPVRDRILDSYYWKEQCFGLNAATLLDRALEITYIGGTYGAAQKPSPFLCLLFKMLQITPSREIVMFYLEKVGEEFKYLRALAALYVRLTFEKDEEIFLVLERFLADKRKLRRRGREGWRLTYVDEWVDALLVPTGRVCAVVLPVIKSRGFLEDEDRLEERVSPLGEEIGDLDGSESGSEGEVEEVDGGRRNGRRSGSSSEEEERSDRDVRSQDGDMDEGD